MAEVRAAAILAGGRGRRLGQDKALLRLAPEGPPLVEQVARAARDAGLEVVIVGRAGPLPFLPDERPGLGPLGGLATALRHLQAPLVALSCDLPGLHAGALRWLVAQGPGEHGLVTRGQPLFSIYTPAVLPLIDARLDGGDLSLRGLIAAGHFAFVDLPEELAPALVNLNTPADLARWRRG